MHSNRRSFLGRSSLVVAGFVAAAGSASAVASSGATGRVAGTVAYGPQPVDGVSVTFDGERGTETAVDGSFERDLEPGTYELAVRADGYADETREVAVAAGETTTVDLRLAREWGPGEGELEVVIVESGGGSTLESQVTVYGNDRVYSAIAPTGRLPDGDTWKRGFVLDEGWWEIRASGVDGYGDGYEEVYVESDGTTRGIVEVPATEERRIHHNGRLVGTVTDAGGGPVPDAVVRIADDDSMTATLTDDDGRFEAELAHGRYAVTVDADGYRAAETDAVVRFGRTTTRDVTLESR